MVGSGKSETRLFDLKDFLGSRRPRAPFTVDLKQGKEFKVSVTADDNLFDLLQVEKEGKKLVIGFKGKNIRINLKKENPLKAAVTLPQLEELRLNGAARANAAEFKGTDPFRLFTNGASRFEGSIKAGDVCARCQRHRP